MGTIKEKKQWAKQLYLRTSLSQKEIAAVVGITEKTISSWINDARENWELLKSSFVITKEQELRRIYIQINELNNDIESRATGKRYASGKEADTLSKLAATAKNLESDSRVADVVSIGIELTNYLLETNPDKAKEFSSILDMFIKHKLSKL